MSVLAIGWGVLLKLNSQYFQVVDKENYSISQRNGQPCLGNKRCPTP
ncbi:MAG: hypothetical protein N2319_13135 [Candidatus Kapabacteria bacterium]|nr:hypothetical protein [Candidatus Kapabacteria bacterium]